MTHRIVLPIFAALVAVFLCLPASADEFLPRGLGHPTEGGVHWYESGCCSKSDCEPVESGAIRQTPEGYRVRYLTSPRPGHPNGFIAEGLIPYGSSSIRPSRDANEHACSNPTRVICIYLPMTM
jgi:hypothetical protein